jgi:HK97 gp10 family phage protein
MDIELEGLEELQQHLISRLSGPALQEAMGKACALVERKAKQNAPKGTGELRRSITSVVREENGEIIGVVFTPLEYAPYVEFGTGLFAENGGRTDVPWHYQDDEGEWHSTNGMKPQPFLRPALNDSREQIKKILKEAGR